MPHLIDIIWIGNDCLLRITGVKGASNGVYLNSASGEVTLVDASTETQITGATWPLALSYVSGSNGDYEVVLPKTVVVTEGQALRADTTIDGGTGLFLSIRLPCVAEYRDGSES